MRVVKINSLTWAKLNHTMNLIYLMQNMLQKKKKDFYNPTMKEFF